MQALFRVLLPILFLAAPLAHAQPDVEPPADELEVVEEVAPEQEIVVEAPVEQPAVQGENPQTGFTDGRVDVRRRFRASTNAAPAFPSFPTPPVSTRRLQPTNFVGGANQSVNPAQQGTNAGAPVLRPVPNRSTRTNLAAPTTVPPPGQVENPPTALPLPGTQTAVAQAAPGQVIPPPVEGAEGIAAGPIAPGLDPNEQIPEGTIALQGLALEPFLDIYSFYSGRTILRPYALPAPAGFTLKAQGQLSRREVVQAMDAVLALNNITMIPYGEKFVKAVPSNLAPLEGAELNEASSEDLPLAEQFVTKVVKLTTAKPSEVAPTLQTLAKTPTAVTAIDSNQTLILRDYASNVKRMMEIIERIDVMPESDFTLEVIPIKYGKVTDIYATMSALISGTGGAVGTGGTTAGGFGTGMQRGGFGTSGGFGGRGMNSFGGGGFGRSSQFGGNNRYGGGGYGNNYGGGYSPYNVEVGADVVTPQQAAPGAAQGSFQQRLNQIVSRAAGDNEEIQILENANIVPDERSNKLLIFANKRDMAMITNIVSKVDVMLAQVLIEAIILEVTLGDSLNVGVSAVQHPKRFGQDFTGGGNIGNGPNIPGVFTNITSDGFTYFGNVGGDFDVAISALATDNKFNVIARPRVQTSHAIPGFFFDGQTRPYVSGVTDYGLVGSGLSTRSSITQQEIGITLQVIPFITPEGMVVLEIEQNNQSFGGNVTIDGNPIPIITSSIASSVLTVRDGDVILLGGFIREDRNSEKSGVPILKDIPGLGMLFRRKTDNNTRREVIILLKATVLETPEQAAFLAETERRQLPGVRQAEREFEQNEAKRMKRVERQEKR